MTGGVAEDKKRIRSKRALYFNTEKFELILWAIGRK